jgi:glyoxylase-like metal-dependent hydrolase (beta-lactamase superfamily II)
MKRVFASAMFVAGAGLLPLAASSQSTQPISVLESYRSGRALLDAAMAAHGGEAGQREVRQMHVRYTGTSAQRYQSSRPNPPWEISPFTFDLQIDAARGRMILLEEVYYAGGLWRPRQYFTDGNTTYFVYPRTATYRPTGNTPAARGDQMVPQFVLSAALESRSALRYVGPLVLASGDTVDGVSWNATTLGFDRRTGQLRAQLAVTSESLLGDAKFEREFLEYDSRSGIQLPGRVVTRVNGEVTDDLRLKSVSPNHSIPDSLIATPRDYAAWTAQPLEHVNTLAPGVWIVGGAGGSLVVEFSDHVIVVDAIADPADVISRVKTLASGKPIRYVIPTHHHEEHARGVKAYAAAGATIVTAPGNEEFMTRLAISRSTLGPTFPPLQGAVKVETVNGRRVFSDGKRTVEIHDLGANPHAHGMLVAWIPEDGILFEGDLYDNDSELTVRRGMNNPSMQHFGEWLKRHNWNVRVFAGAHGFLRDRAAFEEILRQPFR